MFSTPSPHFDPKIQVPQAESGLIAELAAKQGSDCQHPGVPEAQNKSQQQQQKKKKKKKKKRKAVWQRKRKFGKSSMGTARILSSAALPICACSLQPI